MDQFQIFKLLEEATSIKKYDRKYQEALENMAKNEDKKKDIKQLLR